MRDREGVDMVLHRHLEYLILYLTIDVELRLWHSHSKISMTMDAYVLDWLLGLLDHRYLMGAAGAAGAAGTAGAAGDAVKVSQRPLLDAAFYLPGRAYQF